MKRAIKITGILILLLSGVIMSCEKENNRGGLQVNFVDHPGKPSRYDAVNIDFDKIQINVGAQTRPGWMDISTNAGVYNMLNYQNGRYLQMVSNQRIPVGIIKQLRIVLGKNHSVIAGGVKYPLKIDTRLRNTLTLDMPTRVPANDLVSVLIGFNIEASVIEAGKGEYLLGPVVKVLSVTHTVEPVSEANRYEY
jgi:hypothetical protein